MNDLVSSRNRLHLYYSNQDRVLAAKIANDLMQRGVMVAENLSDDETIRAILDIDRLRSGTAEPLAFLVSANSIRSAWLAADLRYSLGLDRRFGGRSVVSVLIGSPDLPDWLAGVESISLSPSYERGIDSLVAWVTQQPQSNARAAQSNQTPSKRPAPEKVFVICAFSRDMESAFSAMKLVGGEFGFDVYRVKDIKGDYRITDEIVTGIRNASFVIADLTHERPNVYFELGYARGLGKTVITTARENTTIHFDVHDWTCLFYDDSRTLEPLLREAIASLTIPA